MEWTDLLGQCTDGTWWLGLANGNRCVFRKMPDRFAGAKIDYVGVGDFNGDGIDDLAIRFGRRPMVDRPFRRPAIRDPNLGTLALRFRRKISASPISMPMAAPTSPASNPKRATGLSRNRTASRLRQAFGAVFGSRAVDWRHILAADFSGQAEPTLPPGIRRPAIGNSANPTANISIAHSRKMAHRCRLATCVDRAISATTPATESSASTRNRADWRSPRSNDRERDAAAKLHDASIPGTSRVRRRNPRRRLQRRCPRQSRRLDEVGRNLARHPRRQFDPLREMGRVAQRRASRRHPGDEFLATPNREPDNRSNRFADSRATTKPPWLIPQLVANQPVLSRI